MLTLLFALSFFIIGCGDTGSPVDPSAEQPDDVLEQQQVYLENVDGEDIYRAFVFAQGPVTGLIPELFGDLDHQTMIDNMSADDAAEYAEHIEGVSEQELTDAWKNQEEEEVGKLDQELNTLSEEVIGHIRSEHPGYFDRLENRMKSGDHLGVQAALASIGEVTVPALAKVLDVSEDVIRGDVATPSPKFFAMAVAVAAAAVAAAVVVVNVAAVVNVVIEFEEEDEPEAASLQGEIITDLVVKRLAQH
ncbi:MAG: hypothetical protein PPP56_06040 [Longimonas sp.]|uniref:hypothetical protein n=1 Tax=Longimonas sp. TaxID=2039626 RepID=UPI003346D167